MENTKASIMISVDITGKPDDIMNLTKSTLERMGTFCMSNNVSMLDATYSCSVVFKGE